MGFQGRTIFIIVMVGVLLTLNANATTYGPYYVECDTALYKDTTFHIPLTNTAVVLFGTIHNFEQLGGSNRKVTSIDFALTNGYSGITYDFLIDSIYVIVERYNADLGDWRTYSFCKMRLQLLNVYNKTCRKFKVEPDYPHTDNIGRQRYRISFTIFGTYE